MFVLTCRYLGGGSSEMNNFSILGLKGGSVLEPLGPSRCLLPTCLHLGCAMALLDFTFPGSMLSPPQSLGDAGPVCGWVAWWVENWEQGDKVQPL